MKLVYARFMQQMTNAAMHVQGAGRAQMTSGNLLVAMFRERDSFAVYLLEKQGVTRFDVINYISHGVSKVDPGAGAVPRVRGVEQDGEAEDQKVKNPLESFCVDLTAPNSERAVRAEETRAAARFLRGT